MKYVQDMQAPDDPDRPAKDGSNASIIPDDEPYESDVGSRRPSSGINPSKSRSAPTTATNTGIFAGSITGSKIANGVTAQIGTNGASRGGIARSRGESGSSGGDRSSSMTGDGDSMNRIHSDSFLVAHVKDWNDDDVGKFYDIVLEAARVLPTLPGREKQPTNALFRALQTVLQGEDDSASEDAKFTPVIFKVGVESGDSLIDGARNTLERLGIHVEWVPDDLTQNIDYYQGIEASQADADLPALATKHRHVHWRDQSGNSTGPERLHDSFVYDRPSSCTGSNTGGTGRDATSPVDKGKSPLEHNQDGDEDGEKSDSFDVYCAEKLPQPRPLTPAKTAINGIIQAAGPNDDDYESSDFISSPETAPPPPSCIPRRSLSQGTSLAGQTSPSTLSASPMVKHHVANTNRAMVKAPSLPRNEMMPDSPRNPRIPKVAIPQRQQQTVKHLGSPGPRKREQKLESSVNAAPSEQSAEALETAATELGQAVPDVVAHEPTEPTEPSSRRKKGEPVNWTADLTATVPQISMFRAHAQRFRHQSLLRLWSEKAAAVKQTRSHQDLEAKRFSAVRREDRALFQWRRQTLIQWERTIEMERKAAGFDSRKLAETTLECLREKAALRRQERLSLEERERKNDVFYQRYESRAERARSFYIMFKALTHWFVRSQEENQRTETARRYMMRLRYFEAWKEYTAINELKVGQFVMKRALAKLKQNFRERWHKGDSADQHYRRNFVGIVFRKLKHVHRARVVCHACKKNIKRNVMAQWLQQARERMQRESQCLSKAGHTTRRGHFITWRSACAARVGNECRAVGFYCRNLLQRTLKGWVMGRVLQQRGRSFVAQKSARSLGNAIAAWSGKANLEQQAAAINYVKVLRDAMYEWTMNQRSFWLQREGGRRILTDSMYKWFVAARARLAMRSNERNLQSRVIRRLRYVAASARNRRRNDRVIAINICNRHLKNELIKFWYQRLDYLTRMEQRAEEFGRQKLKRKVWQWLLARVEARVVMGDQATRFHTWTEWNKLFHKWKSAQEESRKAKITAAYKICKRNRKVSLVRRVLKQINEWTFSRAEQEYVAEQLALHEVQQKSRQALVKWKKHTQQVLSIESRGYNILQVGVLAKWHDQVTQHGVRESRAHKFYLNKRLHIVIRAWALKRLQLRACEHTAMEVVDRSDRVNMRKTLTKWYIAISDRVRERGAQTARTQLSASVPPPPPPPPPLAKPQPRSDPGRIPPYGSSTYATPALRGGGSPHPVSSYRALPRSDQGVTSPTLLVSNLSPLPQHMRGRSQSLGLSQGSTIVDKSVQQPRPAARPTTSDLGPAASVAYPPRLLSATSGYLTHHRGISLPEGRRRSRLGMTSMTPRSLGPYAPFDEDEEEASRSRQLGQSGGDELLFEGNVPGNEGSEGNQGKESCSARAQSNSGRWNPTPLRVASRMPSTTPLAPLPTPFEKQLREQYRNSVPEAAEPPSRPASTALSRRRIGVSSHFTPKTSGQTSAASPGLALPVASRTLSTQIGDRDAKNLNLEKGRTSATVMSVSADTAATGLSDFRRGANGSRPAGGRGRGGTRTGGSGRATAGNGSVMGGNGFAMKRSTNSRVRFLDVKSTGDSSTGDVVESGKGGK